MQTKEKDNLVFIRLFSDEKLDSKLKDACRKHNVKTAVILSGIGQLKKFTLGYFKEKNNYVPEKFEKPHELISLSGNIVLQNEKYICHLHAILSNENKNTVGGHLIDGIVEVTNEIILLKTDINVERKLEEKTGLNGLFLE